MLERPAWFPDWRGETAVLVASGPSASGVNLGAARGKARFIVVNNSWRLAPWADILYACDYTWWQHTDGCPEFPGVRASIDHRACKEWGLNFVHCAKVDDRLFTGSDGSIGWGGNSGFGALNLAFKFGVKKIALVGFDLTIEHGLHWHRDHPEGMNNPSLNKLGRWRRSIDGAFSELTKAGVEAVNCSEISTLQRYPKMSFEEVLK